MSSNLEINQIAQIAINVHDLARSVAFYRDALGVRFLFQAPNLAFFDCGGIRLMLGVAEKPEFDHPSSVLYFKVPDIESAYETLKSRAVAFVDKPHIVAKLENLDLWMAFFRDSEDNMHAITSEVPRS